jgi:hypothetical protein
MRFNLIKVNKKVNKTRIQIIPNARLKENKEENKIQMNKILKKISVWFMQNHNRKSNYKKKMKIFHHRKEKKHQLNKLNKIKPLLNIKKSSNN